MYVKDIFEVVQVDNPCSQPKFLSYLYTTMQLLVAKYSNRYVTGGVPITRPDTLDTEIPVDDAYFNAIVDNIAYMVSGNEDRKVDYVEEADNAYRNVYGKKHRRAQFTPGGYYV